MYREPISIFDGVIVNENSFTELIRNFLRFKEFRDLFIRLLKFEFDTENLNYSNFDTQYTINQFGRPDLFIKTDGAEILVEIKVSNTSLTKNQPEGYYKFLKSKSKAKVKGLILLIPKNYYYLQHYEKKINDISKKEDNIHIQIIFWDEIIELIKDKNLIEVSPLYTEYLSFLELWLQLTPITFNQTNINTMFGKNFPESIQKTYDIIDRLSEEFKKKGFLIKPSKDKELSTYGFHFILSDNAKLFFGIWFNYWMDTGYPLCICIEGSDYSKYTTQFNNAVKKANLKSSVNFEEALTTQIEQFIFEADNCEIALAKILSEFTRSLNPKKK